MDCGTVFSMAIALLAAGALAATGDVAVETIIAPATADNPRNTEGDIVVLDDGTLLCAWSEFHGDPSDFGEARIAAATSTDGGKTFSDRYVLQENVGQENTMSASFLRSQSGDILLFYGVKNSRKDLDFMVRRSTDEAETWSEPTLITPEPGYYVMNNARVIQLADGRIICPMSFSEEVWAGKSFRNVMYFSDGDGHTWQRGEGIVTCPKRGAMEPGLVELDDGRILQIIRTQMGKIWHSYSSDRGNTWTVAEPWTVAAPEAPSTLVRTPDNGDLLLVYNPNVDLDADHSGPRTPLAAAISKDNGKTWSEPKMIEADTSAYYAYTSVTFHSGRALLTYYVHRGNRLSLKFKSLPLSWFPR